MPPIEEFHDACEDWDAEEITTEELLSIASLTLPEELYLEASDHINALD